MLFFRSMHFLGSNIAVSFVDINRMQAHFENIQKIADTTTLPHAMNYLSSQIAEELDHSQLTERLQKAKGQPNSLTPSEKLELWDRLKILSMNLLSFFVDAFFVLAICELIVGFILSLCIKDIKIDLACTGIVFS